MVLLALLALTARGLSASLSLRARASFQKKTLIYIIYIPGVRTGGGRDAPGASAVSANSAISADRSVTPDGGFAAQSHGREW